MGLPRAGEASRIKRWLCSSLLAPLVALSACSSSSTAGDGRPAVRDLAVASCDQGTSHWRLETIAAEVLLNQGTGLPANLFAVWGASATAVWAVGSEGKVIFFDGQSWTAQATTTKATLNAVWGTGPRDVWAAGYDGVVIRFDGAKWQDASPPDPVFIPPNQDGGVPIGDAAVGFRRPIWGVWGVGTEATGTQVLYAVGERGLMLHWSKSVWTAISSNVQDSLNAIWGRGSTVYAVGDFGTALSCTAGTVTAMNTGVEKTLSAIWNIGGRPYTVGLNGTFLRRNGVAATDTSQRHFDSIEGLPKQWLKGLWGPEGDSSRLYVVGIDGILLRVSGGPAFSSPSVELFTCLTKNWLHGIWGMSTPVATAVDAGGQIDEQIWVVGASGTVIRGP